MRFVQTIFNVLVVSVILFSCDAPNENVSSKKQLSIIHSNVETITYSINGDRHPTWKISPEMSPDVLKVECGNEGSKVGFITDVDSIFMTINEKDTVQFIVLLNGKDSALTELVGVPQNVHFSEEYIALHKGKFDVVVPEVHELANIIVAISKIGQEDSNMVDMTTDYYKEVLAHFLPFKDHKAIELMNDNITAVFDNESYWYYYAMKMNACGYLYNDNDEIVDDGIIGKMGFGNEDDPFVKHKEIFEDFALKSNFRTFYADHKGYYNSLITTYRELNPIDKMQNWLEGKFNFKYGNYLVTFSPLVGGAHSTQQFADNGFKQTVMFVCRSEYSEDNRNIDEMLNSRVVFTEIDHNFVNPTTDKYVDRVNEVFSVREKWADDEVNGASAYDSPYAVFNEYMTFALFSLYCIENFPSDDVKTYIPRMERMMTKHRGFINFDAFNQELIRIYESNPAITVDDIYVQMFDWASKE